MSKVIKNGRSKKYSIDGKKLAKALEKKGLVPCELSKELEYHPGYLTKCIRTNTIGEKAIGMLMNYGISPSKYDAKIMVKEKTVGDIFESLPEEAKNEVYSEVSKAVEEAKANPCKNCALRNKETSGPSDCASCRMCTSNNSDITSPLKRNSGRYPVFEDDKSPAEKALSDPGVVKIELTLDMVKLKAIVKQAVKEAYDEI